MINNTNFKEVLQILGYDEIDNNKMRKSFENLECSILVDFNKKEIIYPEDKGLKINMRTTCNFEDNENFVVLECITRLLAKGYRPNHIEIEKKWNLGHESKGGRADIVVNDPAGNVLFIIECKTPGVEYKKELKNIINDGGQLFSYWQQERSCKWLILYTSDFIDGKIQYNTDNIDCSDDENIKEFAKKDKTIKLYEEANNNVNLFNVWAETYEKRFVSDIVFRDDSIAYKIGVKPLRKKDLKDFSGDDKIVNKFEEILRHNNVSDKENAFNRLIALFICKLVDEITKEEYMEVDFQYKIGTDSFESLQDRLQRLHKEGMEKFMKEEIFYVPDDYADKLVRGYTGQGREKMIADLKENLRKLKFYTNNDFAFKEVHNEELFYQNGKILIEVVQLFEKYRIINSKDLQMLGDLFEQLLNKGFKQNEGQFFTPMPITEFIWESLPIDKVIKKETSYNYPKIIDFACGAGHFLTQGYKTVNKVFKENDIELKKDWEQENIYGIEKDYRLARVSKISLFMHGAGLGNIIFGDGLENYNERGIKPKSFDILVANPPYSIKSFKPYLKLKNNSFEILNSISEDGSEIETLFMERISQLLKSNAIAAVILPSPILNKNNESFMKARESILKNFKVRSIVQLGSKTFSATGTNTIVLFLEKFDEPPKQIDFVDDSIQAIFENRELSEWIDKDILRGYLEKIGVSYEKYSEFIEEKKNYNEWDEVEYFNQYLREFKNSNDVKNKENKQTFKKLSVDEQIKLLNRDFYNTYHNREKEKLRYYALAFNQTTLIVVAPDDNKEQEKFLGYKWSNRKGQEGIQIIKEGGKLFNKENRNDDNKISYVVKNSFFDNKVYNKQEEYYHYLKLVDMLDFTNINFYKTINLKRIRNRKLKPEFQVYRLDDTENFDMIIGTRVVEGDSLLKDDGKYPIYSANVYTEMGKTDEIFTKTNFENFSLPSVIWGIDGDWMVNCIPENNPFYPTDHCGVLRVKNKNILPEYVRYALNIEGRYERFSRTNRASIDRIKKLTLYIPTISIQEEIVKKINDIDNLIIEKKKNIKLYDKNIQLKFKEMFNGKSFSKEKLEALYELQLGKTPSRSNGNYWNDGEYKWISVSDMGKYGRYTKNTYEYITQKAIDETKIKVVPKGTVIMSFKLTIGRTSITSENIYTNEAIVAFLPLRDDIKIKNDYLRIWLALNDWTYGQMNAVKGLTLNKVSIGNTEIAIPPLELQNKFLNYVEEQERLKDIEYKDIAELKKNKDKLIEEHFE